MKTRFTLHDLFRSTTLIAVGVCGICLLTGFAQRWETVNALAPMIYFGSTIAVGIGIGVLFQEQMLGGVVGFALGMLILMVMAALKGGLR